MRTVLLTGFEPFDQDTVNPTWEAVRLLDGNLHDDIRIVARQLPCTFSGAPGQLQQLLEEFEPELVIAVGLTVNFAVRSLWQPAPAPSAPPVSDLSRPSPPGWRTPLLR